MDFSMIKSKMEAKDGSGYKNVREIYSDVRLIFKNAMKYNDQKNDIHVMAKTLLDKFEEKWLLLLPKVDEEVIFFSKIFSFLLDEWNLLAYNFRGCTYRNNSVFSYPMWYFIICRNLSIFDYFRRGDT